MSKEDKTMNNELAIKQPEVLSKTDLGAMTLQQLEEVATGLAKSKIIPHDEASDVVAAVMLSKEIGIDPMVGVMMGKKLNKNSIFSVVKGKELGIPPIMAIEQLHYITDDSSSTGIHVMASLALKAGVHTKMIHDYVPVYGYVTADKNWIKKDDFDSDIHRIKGSKDTDETKLLVKVSGVILDYKTSIRFTRKLKNGRELVEVLTYYYSEFANLHKKDNWKNNKKTMLRNRVLAIGYRFIADDVINGLYIDEEITDTHNIKYEEVNVPDVQEAKEAVQEAVKKPKDIDVVETVDYIEVTEVNSENKEA